MSNPLTDSRPAGFWPSVPISDGRFM